MREDDQTRQQDLERLRRLHPIDDDFMRCLFKDNRPLAELVLRIITGKPDLVITEFQTQKDMKRLAGARSICLDAGQDFDQLPDTYTIFITEKDFYGLGKPIYRIERMNLDTGKSFKDGAYILYVNGEYRGTSDIGKLMHDFNCTDANEMNFDLRLGPRTWQQTPGPVLCRFILISCTNRPRFFVKCEKQQYYKRPERVDRYLIIFGRSAGIGEPAPSRFSCPSNVEITRQPSLHDPSGFQRTNSARLVFPLVPVHRFPPLPGQHQPLRTAFEPSNGHSEGSLLPPALELVLRPKPRKMHRPPCPNRLLLLRTHCPAALHISQNYSPLLSCSFFENGDLRASLTRRKFAKIFDALMLIAAIPLKNLPHLLSKILEIPDF